MKAKAKTAKSQHSETYLNQNQQFLMTKVSTGMNMAQEDSIREETIAILLSTKG